MIADVFRWLNDQLLRMQWLADGVTVLVRDGFGLDPAGRIGGSIHFFVYDVIKIFILLSVLIFSLSYVQSYFPPERTRRILGQASGLRANILAALLGTVTPFCSCSSIPIFIGFTSAGLPVGVTFSFLISSPLVDIASVILLASILGWPVALAYVVLGVVIAVIGGTLISLAGMERHVESFVFRSPAVGSADPVLARRQRLAYAKEQVSEIIARVWLYILVGVGIGAAIHNWIPETVVAALLGQDKWWSVLVATLIGAPMYADIFGSLPIAEALVGKGVGVGTVLAFMMAVTALSLPSLILLKRVVRMPLLLMFTGVVMAGIVFMGYLFNGFGHIFL